MKKQVLIIALLIFGQIYAQTGIGTTTPHASAKLDVSATDKGFLPPRVALTATNVASPISSPANGLLVYNTATAGTTPNNVAPGYYFWNTNSWVRLLIPTDNSNNVNGTVAVANGGTGTATGSISGTTALTFSAGGTNQNITLNPSGTGYTVLNNNVGIGTTVPVDRLDIRSAMSVNEIKFRGTDGGDDSDPYRLRKFKIGNSNELQLHLNDDSDERFVIYGNSCLTPGCPEYSVHLYHYFRADGDVYHAGKVGIGTTSPQVPLHVASSVAQYVNVYGYLNQNQAQGAYTANTNVSYSIQADQRIRAPEFNAISDTRIKKDVLKLNTKKQLGELNQLKVVNYSYIDQLVNGTKSKTGFIAQEVEQVNPQFVNQSKDFIPSVFALAKSAKLENEIVNVTTEQPHGFQKGDEVKLFAEGKKEIIKTIEEVKSPQEFSVKAWDAPTDNVFVYGKKVTDFRAIDFDQITALSVASIQELHHQIETLKRENASLKKRVIDTIQKQQSDIEKRLLQLELKLNKRRK
jgi:hypothetical protein